MEERRNVPKLRFPGFTDPWEQRRLGELGSVVMCKRIYKDQTTERGDVPFFKIGTFGGEPDAFISNELFEKYQELYSFPKVGDILISAAGTIGRTTVYQGERAYFQDSNIVWLDHDDRLDNGFLLQYLNDQTWSSLEGSTLKRLYNKDILDARIALPALDEQQCVGSFFAKLDSLIALHQRELDHVKELKKGLLQKMFPKEGTNVPELRFPGFTDPWEQRRLGEIVDVRSGKDYKHLKSGPIPVYGTGGLITYVDDALSKNEDAVGIGRKGTIDQPYKLYAPFWTVDTLFYAVPKAGSDIEFVLCCFQRINWKAKDESTGLPSLSKRAIDDTQLLAPRSGEQSRIGALFAKLDSLIALHQRELDHVKELKKGLLQQMFV